MASINEGRFRFSIADYDQQKRQFSFDSTVITAANHDAQKAQHDALIAAILAVTLGTKDFEEFVADRFSIRPIIYPTAAAAQVNIEWVFTYVDDTLGTPFNVRVPTADVTNDDLFAAGSHLWDPTEALWVTLAAAFDAHILAPITGNTSTLSQVAYLQ